MLPRTEGIKRPKRNDVEQKQINFFQSHTTISRGNSSQWEGPGHLGKGPDHETARLNESPPQTPLVFSKLCPKEESGGVLFPQRKGSLPAGPEDWKIQKRII